MIKYGSRNCFQRERKTIFPNTLSPQNLQALSFGPANPNSLCSDYPLLSRQRCRCSNKDGIHEEITIGDLNPLLPACWKDQRRPLMPRIRITRIRIVSMAMFGSLFRKGKCVLKRFAFDASAISISGHEQLAHLCHNPRVLRPSRLSCGNLQWPLLKQNMELQIQGRPY